MAELVNQFSWSFTRAQMFDACRRRYWFRYYAHWNGWRRDAPELAQRAYLFSKMQSLKMMAGSAVHETIADVLRALRHGREPRSPFEQVRQRMNDAWRASREQQWKKVGPKHAPPIYEHHYELAVTPADTDALRELALRCVRAFLEGDLYREIVKAGPMSFRAIEERECSSFGDVPCFIAPDFAFDRGEETWIIDWKTGGERDDHELQLLAYAEHARRKWKLEPTRLRAFDAMLATGRMVEVPITAERLAAATDRVRVSAEAMLVALADRDRNVARREDFRPTTDAAECRRCFFREICDEQPADATDSPGAEGLVSGAAGT